MDKILLTGPAGFIASHLADELITKNSDTKFVLLDGMKTGANLQWLDPYHDNPNIDIVKMDLSDPHTYNHLLMAGHNDIDVVLHLAAESHVDRSISDGVPFGLSNMMGTMRLLEFCKENLSLKLFLNFSTDEVLGTRKHGEGSFAPYDRKTCRNPYSATKSAQEELGFGYAVTHKIPVITTRCSNIYGPRQYFEKFLPTIISRIINGHKVPVYGQGLQEREWIYVKDVANIVARLVEKKLDEGVDPSDVHANVFHLGSEKSIPNIEFCRMVLSMMNRDDSMIEYVTDRKGHDFRYDMNCSSTHQIGLAPTTSLESGLAETIQWYENYFKDNPEGW